MIANQGAGSTGTTGTVAVIKLGSSTWEFLGDNTYTGVTTVREGTLVFSTARTANLGAITVGDTPGLNGTLNITGGSFTMGADLRVANTSNSSVLNQTDGLVNASGGNQILVGAGMVGASGTYNLSGGTLSTTAIANRGVLLGVNTGTTGTFNLSSNGNLSMPATSQLQLGRSDSAATGAAGIFNQTGGIATIGILTIGGGAGATYSGNSGTLNLTGGTFSAASFTLLGAADNSTANITIGGTAVVTLPAFPTARGVGATTTINFNGGTLIPAAASASYISGLTNAFLTANGAKLEVRDGLEITIPQVLKDAPAQAGTLTKLGNGTLTLSGANTYTGTTVVSAGKLVVSASLAGNATIENGATLGGSGSVSGNVKVNSGGTIEPGSGGQNPLTVSSLTLGTGPGDTASIAVGNLGGGANAAVVNVTAPNGLKASGGAGSVSLKGSLLGLLTGVYKLIGYNGPAAGTSAYVPAFTKSSRQVALLEDLPGVQIQLNLTSDTVKWTGLNSGAEWSAGTLAPNKNWKLTTASSPTDFITLDDVVFDDTATTGSTTPTISSGDVTPGSVTFNNSVLAYNVQGANGITGGGAIVKNGTAAVTLSTPNSHTGGVTLNAGTLNIAHPSALGAGPVTLAGGTLDNLTGAPLDVTANPQNWTGDFTFAGTNNLTVGAATMNGSRKVTVTAGQLAVAGAVSGAGFDLTKAGAGTLSLNAANAYTGLTTILGGTVIVQNSAALGTNAGGTVIASGATLDLGGVLATNALNLGTEVITVSGAGVGGNGALVNNGFNLQINATGRIVLAGDTTFGGTNRWDLRSSTPTLNMNGFTITKEGFNQVSLVATTISNPGNVIINNGSFGIETASNAGGSAANSVTVNPAGTFILYANTLVFPWSIALNNGALSQNSANVTASGPITLAAGNSSINVPGTSLTLTGSVSGAGGFSKNGLGLLRLSGASNYTGETSINDGTLDVPIGGSLSGTTAVNVGSGLGAATLIANGTMGAAGAISTVRNLATLRGAGTMNGSLKAEFGATIAPGNGPGLLTVGNGLTLDGGAHLTLELNGLTAGTGYDQLAVMAGNVSLSGDLVGSTLGFTPAANDLFFIILNNGIGTTTGLLGGVGEGGTLTIGSQDFRISYAADSALTNAGNFGSALGNDVALLAVPEPGALLSLMGGLGMLLGSQRRRRA